MPVPLRATHHRPDAKYNVTTEFPSLGLHSAASTGNVGLVEYALSRGQPVNSVVDGVLPLHAACAGGNVQVVKLLIEYGADVNAPRLPKRYSSRDSSAPIIGTTGSTPLHFAAANGNSDAITLLLLHGAHADRPDKHGVTPETLARQNGWIECANLLKNWILNKDKDLRERKEFVAADDRDQGRRRHRMGSFGDPESSSTTRRRLHVKHSIDTALNMLKSSSSNLAENYRGSGHHTPTPPTSPSRPFGDFSQQQTSSQSGEQAIDSGCRRPSLPHIIQSDSLPRPRKTSSQSTNPHRPRSAGSGAEESERVIPPYGRGGTARRLGSKVSLLNLFRKGQSSEAANALETNTPPAISDAPSLSTSPPNGALSIPGSSLPRHRSHSRFHQDSDSSNKSRTVGDRPLERKSPLNSPSWSPLPMAVDLHNALAQEQQRMNNRDRSRSNASSRYEHLNDDLTSSGGGSYQSPGSSPLARIGLLRNQGHNRNRSGSGSSLTYEANVPSRLGMGSTVDEVPSSSKGGPNVDTDTVSRSLPRSGILKHHNRNGSSGQGHMTPSALRAVSRDAASHSPSPRGTPAGLKSSNSAGSLVRSDSYSKPRFRANRRPGSAGSTSGSASGSKPNENNDDDGDMPIEEEKDEEYGQPIETTQTPSLFKLGKPAESSRTSLSPIISNDHASGEGADTLATEFPFSINRPPLMSADEAGATLISISASRTTDTRNRGNSLSSDGTSDSQELSHTSSITSTAMLSTPLVSTEVPPPSDKDEEVPGSGVDVVDGGEDGRASQYVVVSPASDPSSSPLPQRPLPIPLQFFPPAHSHSKSFSSLAPPSNMSSSSSSLSGRRTHTPFDINISSISTHAQAEALVEKARREVMELASLEEQDLVSDMGGDGRTPLSARLAAYGESLALERRFRELERGGGSAASGVSTSGERSAASVGTSSVNLLPMLNQHSRDGSGYTPSLSSAMSTGGIKNASSPQSAMDSTRNGHTKRPSTAEGLAPRDANLSLSSEQSDQSYQSSRSASALGHRRRREQDTYHQHHPSQLHHAQIPTLNIPSSSDGEDEVYTGFGAPRGYIPRSRTPTGDYENEMKTGLSISRMASLDGMELGSDDFGLPLYRVSTAPSPARLPPAQAQGRSAKKLSKMGISVADQAGRGALPPPPAAMHNGKVLGAIKSLFKGRS